MFTILSKPRLGQTNMDGPVMLVETKFECITFYIVLLHYHDKLRMKKIIIQNNKNLNKA